MFYYDIQEPYRDELLTAVRSLTEARYAIAAVYVLQLYEWVACIGREVPLVQLSRWTSIKVAYLLCRYYPLCIWPLVLWAYNGNHSAGTCSQFASPIYGLLLPCQVFSQAVMLMRAYAFAGRNRRVLLLLGTCFAGLLGVNIWVFWSHIEVPPPLFYVVLNGSGCFPNYGEGTMGLRLGYSMLAALLMDLFSLAVVVVHCQKTRSQTISLARYFVRQGLGAFCFVTAVNVVTAILYFRPPSFHSGEGLPLILVFPNIVACRVILDLRRRASPTDSEIARRNSNIIRNAFEASPDEWAAGDENVMGISNIAPLEC